MQSLRILAGGIAAVGYGQVFSVGVSDGIKEAFGFFLPGLPLFCSAAFSLTGLGVRARPTGKQAQQDLVHRASKNTTAAATADLYSAVRVFCV